MHRLQHTPPGARHGQRHTSTATVAVIAAPPGRSPSLLRRADLRVETMRGRGRGGQRRNKVETAVRIRHLPSGIVVTRTSGRSQAANIAAAQAEIEHRLNARAGDDQAAAADAQRRSQARRGSAAKVFTHNAQRRQVTDHVTGRSWPVRAWRQGRFDNVTTGPQEGAPGP